MTTDNHTAIATSAAANASTFNTPLGSLDAAIGDISGFSASDLATIIATIIDTDATMAAGAVDNAAALASDVVTTAKILNANVTTAKIADANVTTAKIANDNVTTAKIANDNVTTAKIADDNVTTAKIADDNITWAKLALNAAAPSELVEGWALAGMYKASGAPSYHATYTETVETVNVTWPDGSAGVYTATAFDSTWEVPTAFNITHADGNSGAGWTVDFSGLVLDNVTGLVTTQFTVSTS